MSRRASIPLAAAIASGACVASLAPGAQAVSAHQAAPVRRAGTPDRGLPAAGVRSNTKASVSITHDHPSSTGFGFRVDAPPGSRTTVVWTTNDGRIEKARVTRASFFSGVQTGWSSATATVMDSSGGILATDTVLAPATQQAAQTTLVIKAKVDLTDDPDPRMDVVVNGRLVRSVSVGGTDWADHRVGLGARLASGDRVDIRGGGAIRVQQVRSDDRTVLAAGSSGGLGIHDGITIVW